MLAPLLAHFDKVIAKPGRLAVAVDQRQQRPYRCANIANQTQCHGCAAPDVIDIVVDLDNRPSVGKEFRVGEIGAQHKQHIAIVYSV